MSSYAVPAILLRDGAPRLPAAERGRFVVASARARSVAWASWTVGGAMAQRVQYGATAVRPSWGELPDVVRDLVVGWIGEPVGTRSAGGGFTRGFASALTGADGRTTFVKAVPFSNVHIAASYRREIAVNAVLPEAVPAPRLLRSAEVGDGEDGWVVLSFEHVEGRMPGDPWTAADLEIAVASLEEMAETLRALRWDDPSTLAAWAAEDGEVFTLWASYDGSALEDGLDEFVAARRARLATATSRALDSLRGDAWGHCDVRADNLVMTDERAWVVDWNWTCRAPAWADLGLMLPQVHADGVDVAPAYASPLLAYVDPDDLDAAIAWLGTLMLHLCDQPVVEGGSPWIRPHQRWTAQACLGLLRARWEC